MSPVRILIVDDSAVIRSVITQTLKEQPDIEVIGTAANGEIAVESVKTHKPNIVILDIEMPVMDGLTALPLILEASPDTKVLICSTLSARGADISIKALSLGAAECVLKPGGGSITSASEFKKNLVSIIRSLFSTSSTADVTQRSFTMPNVADITLRAAPSIPPPSVLAIGSSTGGPKALLEIMKDMRNLPFPVVITQHMPKTFTALLAQHITKECNVPCKEGEDGDVIMPGHAYIAPGDYHMYFERTAGGTTIRLNQDPPENFCRPAVDPMIRSLTDIYGNRLLAVILTGMGSDGLNSCKALVEKGGHVIAQDEKTSVVWGMPGAVATAGLCSAVLPLDEVPAWVSKVARGGNL